MMTKQEPTATHLFSIPCQMNGEQCQLLIYSNDLDVRESSNVAGGSNTGQYYSPLLGRNVSMDNSNLPASTTSTSNDDALMIVAIPNVRGGNVGLIDLSTSELKEFRTKVKEMGESVIPFTPTLGSYGNGMSRGISSNGFSSLAVHKVGNYDISVAPTLEALEEQVDWSHFSLPHDFESRKRTLSNKTLFPFDCSYVVAKARVSVKDDGFGIVFRDPGFTYFPTCHEGASNNVKKYDVRCYEFGNKNRHTFPFRAGDRLTFNDVNKKGWVANVEAKEGVAPCFTYSFDSGDFNLLDLIPRSCLDGEGRSCSLKVDKSRINRMNVCPLKTNSYNQNILVK